VSQKRNKKKLGKRERNGERGRKERKIERYTGVRTGDVPGVFATWVKIEKLERKRKGNLLLSRNNLSE
jgi:hypothetical protein